MKKVSYFFKPILFIKLLVLFTFNSMLGARNLDSLKRIVLIEKVDTNKLNQLILISNIYIKNTNHIEAKNILDSAMKIANRINLPKFKALVYKHYGRNAAKQEDYKTAELNYLKSIKEFEDANLKNEIATMCGWIGNIYYYQSNMPASIEYYIKAIKLFEIIGDKKSVAGYAGNIGAIYESIKKYDEALNAFDKALIINKQIHEDQNIAINLVCIGNVNSDLKKYDKALQYYNDALKINIQLGDSDYICNNYQGLANASLLLKKYEDAFKYASKANKIAKVKKLERDYITTLINMAISLLRLNKINEAQNLFMECLELTKKINSFEVRRDLYNFLSEFYSKKNDLKNELFYYKLSSEYKDSLLNEDNNKKILSQGIQYEYEKKAAADSVKVAEEKKLTTIKLKQEKVQRYYLYGGLGLVGLFALFMVNRFRVTNKQKKLIEDQKKILEHQKQIVDEKQKEILDSIHYAKRIQQSLLPTDKFIDRVLKNKL